jgi:hypothetical protein
MSGLAESELKGRFARATFVPLIAILVGLGLSACGSAHKAAEPASHASSSQQLALPKIEPSEDADDDSDKYGSEPDNENEAFGHPADAGDARHITAVLRRYYAAAARGDGALACELLYSPLAEAVPEDYGGTSAPAAQRGETCAVVLSKLFDQQHAQLKDGSKLRVAAVRVYLNRASARFGLGNEAPDQYIMAHRERGPWKVDMLFGLERPVGVE